MINTKNNKKAYLVVNNELHWVEYRVILANILLNFRLVFISAKTKTKSVKLVPKNT